jgi:hypothetical protein
MAYEVKTDHKIVGGEHLMQLLDTNTLEIIVTATRDPATGVWTVHAENASVPDVTAPTVAGSPTPRSEAITAMVNQALAALPGSGYSTLVPYGLPETS